MVQGYGRSIRSKEDFAKTYVLDSAFGPFVDRNTNIPPLWYFAGLKDLKVGTFADEFFTDFEEIQEEIEDAFMDINDEGQKELMGDYETLKDVGVREFSSFVYGYSMTIEYDDKPRIRKIPNEGGGSSRKRRVSKYNKQHITSERESLAEVNIYDREVKVVLEMPGASKDHIKIRAYENSVEILNDHPQRYQVINIPQVADIKTIRATYKNGILEIVFKKKEKLKPNNKRREIKIE